MVCVGPVLRVRHEVEPIEYGRRRAVIRQVSTPVPDPRVRHQQRWGTKPGVLSKGRTNHPPNPGQGQGEWVNVSELSMRRRHGQTPEDG